MSRCKSCDGIIGVDCFNPYECQRISNAIDREKEHRQDEIDYLQRRIEVAEKCIMWITTNMKNGNQ